MRQRIKIFLDLPGPRSPGTRNYVAYSQVRGGLIKTPAELVKALRSDRNNSVRNGAQSVPSAHSTQITPGSTIAEQTMPMRPSPGHSARRGDRRLNRQCSPTYTYRPAPPVHTHPAGSLPAAPSPARRQAAARPEGTFPADGARETIETGHHGAPSAGNVEGVMIDVGSWCW